MTLYDTLDGRAPLPPLGNASRQVLALTPREQNDARLLALIAQRDPVHLARLTSLANGTTPALRRPALGAHDAIDAIGVDVAHAAMRAIASATEGACNDGTSTIRQWLLRYGVNLALTTRRIAAAARVDERRFADVCTAALFDVLGVHAALARRHPRRAWLCDALRPHAEACGAWPRGTTALRGYWRLSAAIARHWGAGDGVVAAIVGAGCAGVGAADARDGALLWLAHELLARRADGPLGALHTGELPAAVATDEVLRLAESRPIDLAFLDA